MSGFLAGLALLLPLGISPVMASTMFPGMIYDVAPGDELDFGPLDMVGIVGPFQFGFRSTSALTGDFSINTTGTPTYALVASSGLSGSGDIFAEAEGLGEVGVEFLAPVGETFVLVDFGTNPDGFTTFRASFTDPPPGPPSGVIPLPATLPLLLSGLFGLGWMRRRAA